jgi:hypothetical protein
MVNLSEIRQNYERKGDFELMRFAEKCAFDLTPEALAVLKEEFAKRQLDQGIFEEKQKERTEKIRESLQKSPIRENETFTADVWQLALDEKEKGSSNEEIIKQLSAKNLDSEQAFFTVSNLEAKANSLLKKANDDYKYGGIACAIGLALTAFNYMVVPERTFFVTWGVILVGGIIFVKGHWGREKYTKVLENIKSEK